MAGVETLARTGREVDAPLVNRFINRRSQWRLLVVALLSSDIIAIGLAFRLAYFVRFETGINIFRLDAIPDFHFYQRLVVILIPAWLVVFAFSGLYDRQYLLGGTEEYAKVFRATAVGLLMVVVTGFLEPLFIIARGWVLLAWVFAAFLTALGRFGLRRAVYAFRQRGHFLSPAIIVGANEEGKSLAEQLMKWKTSGLRVLGFIDNAIEPGAEVFEQLRSLGTLDQHLAITREYGIEELILSTSALSREEMLELYKAYGVSDAVNLRMSSGLFEIMTTGLNVKELAYVPLVGINKLRLTGIDRMLKLLLDYALALPGLLLISPLLMLIAVAIKLESPGPVIHRRRVMGLGGTQFDAFKFRTMKRNGHEILAGYPDLQSELERNHKLKEDPRVTRIGRVLRKFSLDELPQLVNVLARQMSLVGPRMISPAEWPNYRQWDLNLLTVRPGITGLWQVSGRAEIAYDERVRLDMYYVRNWTIWLDLQLLLRTVPAVLSRRGAY